MCSQAQQQLLDLLVLDCRPVTQGRITADTSVVVTDCWDWADPPGPAPPSRPLRLCVSDFAHYADSLGGGRSLLDNRKLLGSGFCGVLQALECRLEVRVVDAGRRFGGTAVDVDSCVFVSKQLLLRLGLFNQEWVKLWRPGGSSRERPVSVLAVEPGPEPQKNHEDGFISATLWFNMTDGDQVPERSCVLRMKVQRSFLMRKSSGGQWRSKPVSCLRGGNRPLRRLVVLTVSAALLLHRSPASFTSSRWRLRFTTT